MPGYSVEFSAGEAGAAIHLYLNTYRLTKR